MLKKTLNLAMLGLLVWAAWMVWQPPNLSQTLPPIVRPLPELPGETDGLWRVVTRRMILAQAVQELGKTLAAAGLPPAITVKHQEQVELYAFDDPRRFATRDAAVKARNEWKRAGFDAELIKPDANFGVALGRLYMAAYAEELKQRLERAGRSYAYHRRVLNLPTWRFTFVPARYAEAKLLWLKVQALGVADPVLMRESRFTAMFGSRAGASAK